MYKPEDKLDHVIICDKNEKIRYEWIKNIKVKFKEIIKKRQVTDYDKINAEEMEKYSEKCFNKAGNSHANQKFLGMR